MSSRTLFTCILRSPRWAINLASTDLSGLSLGQMSDLQYEFEALVTFEMNCPYMLFRNIEGPTYTAKTIACMQLWLKINLQSLVDGGVMTYQAPKEEHYLFHVKEGNEFARLLAAPGWVHQVLTTIGDCPSLFFRLLTTHAEALRRCDAEDCRAVFLRDRRDQRYCSKGCLWRTTTRRSRQTPSDRFSRKKGRPPKPTRYPLQTRQHKRQ
jgi:hypothetical protein